MTNQHDDSRAGAQQEHPVNIQIDRVHYQVVTPTMTGLQLRGLPATSIPADRDLFLVVPGGTDRKIADDEQVKLHNGARFFTAPGQINPGLVLFDKTGGPHGATAA